MKHGIRLTFQLQEPDPNSGRGVSLRCPSRPSRLKSNTPPYIRQLDTVFWTTLYKIVCFPRCDSKLSSSVDYLPSIECRQFFAVNCLLSILCRRLFAVNCLPSIVCFRLYAVDYLPLIVCRQFFVIVLMLIVYSVPFILSSISSPK